MIACQMNSTIHNSQAIIKSLMTNDGTLPKQFPQNYLDIKNVTEEQIKTLLSIYQQLLNGNLDICK